jgi:hypothetical protein
MKIKERKMQFDFFSWSTDICIVVLLFLLFVALFHVVLVLIFPLNDIQWKCVDYIWVGFSIFALITYVADFRKYTDKIDFAYKDSNWRSMIPIVEGYFTWMEGYLCHTEFTITENSPKNWQDTDNKRREACKFITEAQKTVNNEVGKPEPDLRPELIQNGKDVLEAALGRNYIDSIFNSLKNQHELTRIRNELKEKTRDDLISLTKVVALFCLLFIALPLRLTKVTGDVKNARKKPCALQKWLTRVTGNRLPVRSYPLP